MLDLAHFGSQKTLEFIPAQALVQGCHFGSLKSDMEGVFTPKKQARATQLGFKGGEKRKSRAGC